MIRILAFYHFTPLDDAGLERLRTKLEELGPARGLRGLILLGHEGINLTASGEPDAIADLGHVLTEELGLIHPRFKYSEAARHPFQVWRVKIREEIVTLGRPDLYPTATKTHHLSPREWHEALSEPDVVVLDTRNDYEVELGKFEGAIDLKTKEFREFPDALRSAAVPKDKKILIYCTGGIRCEKAIFELNEQGYADVHQLEGGILNYLSEFPEQKFAGECFVFDYRVAVDQNLKPTTRYQLCPHCGQPAHQVLACAQCEGDATLCTTCASDEPTCSKNCAHHRAIGSRSRRPHAQEMQKRSGR